MSQTPTLTQTLFVARGTPLFPSYCVSTWRSLHGCEASKWLSFFLAEPFPISKQGRDPKKGAREAKELTERALNAQPWLRGQKPPKCATWLVAEEKGASVIVLGFNKRGFLKEFF